MTIGSSGLFYLLKNSRKRQFLEVSAKATELMLGL
jgi:hypothetical protein